jgi:hypothetical protein
MRVNSWGISLKRITGHNHVAWGNEIMDGYTLELDSLCIPRRSFAATCHVL